MSVIQTNSAMQSQAVWNAENMDLDLANPHPCFLHLAKDITDKNRSKASLKMQVHWSKKALIRSALSIFFYLFVPVQLLHYHYRCPWYDSTVLIPNIGIYLEPCVYGPNTCFHVLLEKLCNVFLSFSKHVICFVP
jgi:hypothetical protein